VQDVNDAISTSGSRGLAKYAEKCTAELNKIVELVRGTLTKLQRATCGALVVIDVHARDVTAGMARQQVEHVRDFKWESQLRCAPCQVGLDTQVWQIRVGLMPSRHG
jgi:dynein heavy chain, axonemal